MPAGSHVGGAGIKEEGKDNKGLWSCAAQPQGDALRDQVQHASKLSQWDNSCLLFGEGHSCAVTSLVSISQSLGRTLRQRHGQP